MRQRENKRGGNRAGGLIRRFIRTAKRFALSSLVAALASCSATKYIPKSSYLLVKNNVRIEKVDHLAKHERVQPADLEQFNPELQSVGDNGAILVRVGLPRGATDAQQNQRVTEIKDILGNNVEYSQVQIVGPKIGGELVRGGILAVLFSFVLMAIYIWVRYRGGYAIGSFISLCLDFVIMFGFFSITGLEFNQTAIAVILMGVGYSINDTRGRQAQQTPSPLRPADI